MARKRLGDKLKAGGVVARASSAPARPRPVSAERRQAAANTGGDRSMPFVQTKGPRANQSYAIKKGVKGNVRVYDDGSKIGVPGQAALGTAGARSPRPSVLRNQQQADVADTAQAAELYRKFLNKQRPAGARMSAGGQRKTKLRW